MNTPSDSAIAQAYRKAMSRESKVVATEDAYSFIAEVEKHARELGAAQPAAACIWPDCGHDGNGVGQSCCRAIKQPDSIHGDVPFATVQRVVKALTWLGRAAPSSQEMQAAQAVELIGWLCDEVLRTKPSEQPAAAGHGVIHATIRATNEDDVLHVECRFDDGQKYAAIEVSGHRAEELADTILSALTEVPAAAGELPEAVSAAHVIVNRFGATVNVKFNTGPGYNFTVADFVAADKLMPNGAPHVGKLLYDADQLRAAVAAGTPSHYELVDKLYLADLRERARLPTQLNEKEVWYWQGDGYDFPESLVCPVVMSADTLRGMLAAVAGYRRDAELAKDAGHDGAIRYVLGYLNGTGGNGSTMYDEILCACGRERIIRSAIEDGELEFTGLGTYIKNYGTKKEKAMLRAALANLGSGEGKEGDRGE